MAFGLQIFSSNSQEVFNSTNAFGFIEIGSYDVPNTGSGGPTNFAPAIVTDDGFTDVFLVYTPEELRGSDTTNTEGTARPIFSSSAALNTPSAGFTTFTISYTWFGDAPGAGNNQMNGGRVLVFAR